MLLSYLSRKDKRPEYTHSGEEALLHQEVQQEVPGFTSSALVPVMTRCLFWIWFFEQVVFPLEDNYR